MTNSPIVEVKIVDKLICEFGLPNYATKGSAGMDLKACIEKPLNIWPGETKLVPTGIAIHIQDPEYAAILLPRSGLGHKHGIVLGNLVGLVDSDYQGQIFVSCWNRNESGNAGLYTIQPGERIAQLCMVKMPQMNFVAVKEFTETERGENGFGSSGKI